MNIQIEDSGIFSNKPCPAYIVITVNSESERDEIYEMVKGFARASKHNWNETYYTYHSQYGDYAIILTGNTPSGLNIAADYNHYCNQIQE